MNKILPMFLLALMLRVFWSGGTGIYLHPTGATSILVKLDNGELVSIMRSQVTKSKWVIVKGEFDK